ncbi:hypothetical protein ST47_g9916 [Ascochyta rabiei]|uniref:Heterokaryon incompatibility domain-containing protein n=2 Tax=Didymella rabiei TaxID=5454 RepID=A0A162WC53_DIDRA|nr:hypothetical protein ST47_g9916 [Ascochyta rabiei]
MMDRIFRSAEAVHCWLGASPSLATSLAQVGKKSNRGSNEQEFEAVLRKKDDAMGVLARCEYWTRMWIVQEFLLARSIILVAGPVQIPFQLMDVTIAELANAEHRQWENVEAGIAARILQLRRMRNDRFGRDFEGLFEAFNSMRCAVPRDRMFSLLGILQPKEAKMLRRLVDYEADIWHVRNRILESGLVRDYLWFMQHFAISVALSEPDPTTTEQVSLPFYPCLQTVEHAVHDDSGTRRPPFEGPWHFHSCLPCHRGRWLQDMYIPCRWLQYMSCSYDLIRISGAWHSNFQLHGCALIPLCGADCRRECQGHAIAGVALILEDYSPLDQNPIEPVFGWAQTLVRGPAAYDSNWDFAFADIRHATTVADALEPATSSITVVRVSKSKYSTMHMRTSAKAFVQLCDFFSKLDRSYRLEPRPLLPPRSAVSPAASAEMIIGAYIPSPGAGGSLFRP